MALTHAATTSAHPQPASVAGVIRPAPQMTSVRRRRCLRLYGRCRRALGQRERRGAGRAGASHGSRWHRHGAGGRRGVLRGQGAGELEQASQHLRVAEDYESDGTSSVWARAPSVAGEDAIARTTKPRPSGSAANVISGSSSLFVSAAARNPRIARRAICETVRSVCSARSISLAESSGANLADTTMPAGGGGDSNSSVTSSPGS